MRTDRRELQIGNPSHYYERWLVSQMTMVSLADDPERPCLLRTGMGFYAGQQKQELGVTREDHSMAPEAVIKLLFDFDLIARWVVLIMVLLVGLWTYTKFVIERALLPPVGFTLDCHVLGEQSGKRLVEVLLHLRNAGGATLVATDIATRLRYITSDDSLDLLGDPTKSTFGRANFPHRTCIPSLINITTYNTFVQPGIDQIYTLVTAVPASATFLLIWAQFRYAQRRSLIQLVILKFSRLVGLTCFDLNYAKKPHTVERAFKM